MDPFETWNRIPGFEDYQISNFGNVRRISPRRQNIQPFALPDGSLGVKFYAHRGYHQHLVRRLVASAFCTPLREEDDSVIQIDGDKLNCRADNLAWRPRWFVWRYTHQWETIDFPRWQNAVRNLSTGMTFPSIIHAGLNDCTLWDEILESCITGRPAYPFMHYSFEPVT